MNKAQFNSFDNFRNEFRSYCSDLNNKYAQELIPIQKDAAKKDTPEYLVETPVVYNTALDEITEKTEIHLIVIGDNPGKNEQLKKNQKYLVGQAGKIAAGFFEKNRELKTDFRKNVIILNKTPFHSAKTNHLKQILKNASPELQNAIKESFVWMAKKTAELHQNLCVLADKDAFVPELWLVGYAELKNKGIFTDYRDVLLNSYEGEWWKNVFVFQHFSMNRFTIDLKEFRKNNPQLSVIQSVHELGKIHKNEIFPKTLLHER